MRSWVFLTALVAGLASSTWLSQVDAAACANICYTTELTGFGPGGTAGCSCSGSGATRAGSGSCSCGQCYEETNGAVIGYAINSDGTCTYGTDCGDCTYSSDASSSTSTTSSSANPSSTTATPSATSSTGSSTTTTTDAPSTTSPAATSGASSNSTSSSTDTTSSSSNTPTTSTSSSSNDNAGSAGSTATSDTSNNGLKTWQIALIICCGVLVFTVAVVSVLSCYCKARNRLYENEDEQADASYYQQQNPRLRQDVVGSGAATPTLFSQVPNSTRSHARSGSSGSFSNELKPMYANSANSGSTDRLGVGLGLAPVHMRNSSGDLAGMAAGSYSNDRILSGSYPTDRRPSSSNRSLGRRPSDQYNTARDRDSLAVEL
ncbi:hypothetical protein PRIC1_012058 [Phytophthora ramorum]|uniref:uncharacterized protein n=1 Tax=Phytophthora ramorum TaxID=164328 RepID=UPI003098ADF9|nr:hypothetical protein KRP23_9571 [Phytophthora ramorum]KAH7496491.1 hypothetical protein KRP22_13778 [Phytophthora ramorum]